MASAAVRICDSVGHDLIVRLVSANGLRLRSFLLSLMPRHLGTGALWFKARPAGSRDDGLHD
jgi:hypothetical protein